MQIFYFVLSILLESLKCIVFEERCGQKTDNFGAAVLIFVLVFCSSFLAISSCLRVQDFVCLFYVVNWVFISWKIWLSTKLLCSVIRLVNYCGDFIPVATVVVGSDFSMKAFTV